MRFTQREQQDLLKSWLAISVAFAIVLGGGFTAIFNQGFVVIVLLSGITVGFGFLLHELAHKWVANNYGCYAEYYANNMMLVVALATSLLGVIFAAPGAVHISGRPSREQTGKIGLAGPVTNIILALFFILIAFVLPETLQSIAGYGALINTWLALFNMLPFGFFDGAKVIAWNKVAFGVTLAVASLLLLTLIPLGLIS